MVLLPWTILSLKLSAFNMYKPSLPPWRWCILLMNQNEAGLFSSVQSLSRVWLFVIAWTATCQASLSITNSQSLHKHVHWVGDAIQPSHPLLSPSPALNLSQHQGLFQWVSSSHQVTKYWSFSFNISPYNEYSRLIAFSIDWFDLLAVQETQESSSRPKFKSIKSLALSFLYSSTHIYTWLWEKP